jgi:glycosyltransferase involved in cell wall biosynthesis
VVVCIVPARDEADRVAGTVKALYEIPMVDRVVVADDGSTDGTAAAAMAAGATVLSSARGVGKGGALEAALSRVPVPDIYLLVDADVGETAAEAERLVQAVAEDHADLAIGRLPRPEVGGFGLVKRMAACLIRRGCGFEATEPLSGQRAIRAQALHACRPLARGFGVETAMTIDAVRRGFRVVELDVAMRHRPTGRDVRGFVHRGRQGMQILMAGLVRLVDRRR